MNIMSVESGLRTTFATIKLERSPKDFFFLFSNAQKMMLMRQKKGFLAMQYSDCCNAQLLQLTASNCNKYAYKTQSYLYPCPETQEAFTDLRCKLLTTVWKK